MSKKDFRIIEKYGVTGSTNVYLKPEDQNKIVRLSVDTDNQATLNNSTKSHIFYNFCRKVFLPQGYPKTVSDDYFRYQFYDTIQAFASRITGTIATKSILKGVGVGNAEATPLSAAITWIFKDGTGMFGGILFAWWKGTEFDSDCKKWRLFADILNDAAITLELFLPHFVELTGNGTYVMLTLLCMTTCMKAAVGVAGSATRAAVTQHQAIAGNAADVAAKDGSQETAVNLVASIVGILLLTLVHDSRYEWSIFFLFTLLHLFANYLAVSSLIFRTLNALRFNIILRSYCRFDDVPFPEAVNRMEPVVFCLKNKHSAKTICGYKVHMGTTMQHLTTIYTHEDLEIILNIYKNKPYILVPNVKARQIYIILRNGETSDVVITAYFHAIILALAYHMVNEIELEFLNKKTSHNSCLLKRLSDKLRGTKQNKILDLLDVVREFIDEEGSSFVYELEKKGWRTNLHSISMDDWRVESL